MNTNFPSITSQRWFPVAAMLVPSRGTPTWRLHAKVDKFGQNIVAHIWKLDKTWILVTLFAYSSSFICQILGIYLVYFPFLFLIAWPKIIIYSQTYGRKLIAYTTGVILSRKVWNVSRLFSLTCGVQTTIEERLPVSSASRLPRAWLRSPKKRKKRLLIKIDHIKTTFPSRTCRCRQGKRIVSAVY